MKYDTPSDLLADTMTAGELAAYFGGFPPDYKVVATSNYGNRGNTEQVHVIQDVDVVEMENDQELDTTGYSNSGIQVKTLNGDFAADPLPVILIRLN